MNENRPGMILRLLHRALTLSTDDLKRELWTPKLGDRVEFIRKPADTMGNKGVMDIGDQFTITAIEHWNYGTRVTLSKDDATEAVWEFFKKEYVKVLHLWDAKSK